MTSSKPSTSPKQLPDAQADQPDTRILNLMQYKKKRTIFNTTFSKTAKRGKKLQGTRNRVIFSAFILISCTQRCYNKSHFLGSINICEALGWNLISDLFLLNVGIVLFQTRGIKKVLKYWIDTFYNLTLRQTAQWIFFVDLTLPATPLTLLWHVIHCLS